jgi:hypothetical protein
MPSRERMRGDAFSACAAGRTVGIFRVPVRGVLCGVTSPATVRATGAAGHDALDPNSKRSSRDAGIHRRTPQALDPRAFRPRLRAIYEGISYFGLRYRSRLRAIYERASYFGLRYRCPLCCARLRTFLPYGPPLSFP